MKIDTHAHPRMTLEEFADAHGLVMEVRERRADLGFPEGHPSRWYAKFTGAEIAERGMLASVSGNGSTPEDAITDYGRRISERDLVVGAYTPERREIRVPVIVRGAARRGLETT